MSQRVFLDLSLHSVPSSGISSIGLLTGLNAVSSVRHWQRVDSWRRRSWTLWLATLTVESTNYSVSSLSRVPWSRCVWKQHLTISAPRTSGGLTKRLLRNASNLQRRSPNFVMHGFVHHYDEKLVTASVTNYVQYSWLMFKVNLN